MTIGDGFQKEAQLTVYLVDGIATERMHQISDAMARMPGAEYVQLVTPQQAYARLRQSLGPQQQLLDGVEETFLPASIEVKFRPGVADVFQLHPAYERLQHLAGVEAVEWSGDWLSRLLMVRQMLNRVTVGVRVSFVLVTLLVVMGIVRLGLQKRRVELHAMRTIGATTTQLRLPFVCEGVGQGLIAALVSLVTLFVLYQVALPRIEPMMSTFLIAGRLHFFSFGYVILLFVASALLGGASNFLAIGKAARA
jgi:cell division transport system permease protein